MLPAIIITAFALYLAHGYMKAKRAHDQIKKQEQEFEQEREENQHSMERMGIRIQNAQDRAS